MNPSIEIYNGWQLPVLVGAQSLNGASKAPSSIFCRYFFLLSQYNQNFDYVEDTVRIFWLLSPNKADKNLVGMFVISNLMIETSTNSIYSLLVKGTAECRHRHNLKLNSTVLKSKVVVKFGVSIAIEV